MFLKKWIVSLLSLILFVVLLFPFNAAAGSFPDIDGHWAEEEIQFLKDEGLVSGMPDGTFGVSLSVTRAQAATFIVRQKQLSPVPSTFPDVNADHWANGNIGAAAEAGFMTGYSDGTFKPSETLTRAEAAQLFTDAFHLEQTGSDVPYTDIADHWAYDAVGALTANFLARGFPDGTFRPEAAVTRAEFAVFLARALHEPFTEELRILSKSREVIKALESQDMNKLQSMVHPVDGVRFSPYVNVQNDHLVFAAGDLDGLLSDSTEYEWGTFDGTGDPIIKTFAAYYDRFLYNADYVNPDEVVYNEIVSRGSLINNIKDYYPDAVFVEYHTEGTEEYAGMDWRSLNIVFREYDGTWYVIALVNDEWTT